MQISKYMFDEFRKARELLVRARRVLIISHVSPDPDAVGANCALKEVLRRMGKEVRSVSMDKVLPSCLFIKGADEFLQHFRAEDFDLFVSVDCGGLSRVGFKTDGLKPFINIDHHESNDFFGDVHLVLKDACSTCEILFGFFDFCEFEITPEVATALLAGIYFDTGSLMHPNVNSQIMEMVAKIVRKGGNLQKVVRHLFKTIPVEQLKLWGKILERARINEDGVATSAALESDYSESGAGPDDVGGVVDFLNSVAGTKFCVLLSEDKAKGQVKGSVRTQNRDYDVSKVAGMLGGGGHKMAAGFGVPGTIRENRVFKIVER